MQGFYRALHCHHLPPFHADYRRPQSELHRHRHCPPARSLNSSPANSHQNSIEFSSSFKDADLVSFPIDKAFPLWNPVTSKGPIPHSEGKLRAGISNTDFSADNSPPEHDANDVEKTDQSPSGKEKSNLQAAGTMAALIAAGAVGAIALTLASGGPRALIAAVAKSGCFAAFALIFVSEIGDKTFFIAALLAMRQSKSLVLLGSSAALALMTVISVIIGRLFQKIPAQLQTALPLGEYAAIALLIIFGIRAIKNTWDLPPPAGENSSSESGELKEAEEFVGKVAEKRLSSPFEVLSESFSLVFVAEWGDRSMLATVALAAAQSPWGVATGAIIGHVLATSLAVVGGAFLAQYISEKLVGYTGGVLFLAFAVATMMGAF